MTLNQFVRYVSRRVKQPTSWLGVASAIFALVSHDWQVSAGLIAALLPAGALFHIDEAQREATK